ncbi:Fic family protein [Bifidobacterium italicum]|uniref:Fic family protein n=1 Tax=Bifidobacterium italicum TaxID=1960968 RepID=A0A2A2EKW0_9BIFI|nr:Fic family protein [Bifidobacterium italicum]
MNVSGGARLCEWLRRERDEHISGGLFETTQVLFAFNSNHMEGSTLSVEQTSDLYTTGSMSPADGMDAIRLDDAIETRNHFHAFNWMLDRVDRPVDDAMICSMHAILKRGTSQEQDPDNNVGAYKARPNVIGGLLQEHTVLAADVPAAMREVIAAHRELKDDPFSIAFAHWLFETTHPFFDGNGRVGRLLLFKELLRIDAMPMVIQDRNRGLYVRGLREFGRTPGYLIDTLLAERDVYRGIVETMAPDRTSYTYHDAWDGVVARRIENPYLKHAWDELDIFGACGDGAVPGPPMRGDVRGRA